MVDESTIASRSLLPTYESLYGEEGKFPVDPDTVARLRREAEEQGLIFRGDATVGEKLSEFIRNAPDAAYSFLARGAEGTAELAVGLALLTYKGGRLATETDPEKLKEIMAEPSFTKYLGEFRGALGNLNLGENRISGPRLEDITGTIGYYTAPVPVVPVAKGAGQIAKGLASTQVGKNIVDELATTARFFPDYNPLRKFQPKSVGAKAVDQRPVGVKLASEMSDEPLNVMSISRDRKQKLANVSKKRAEGMQGKVLEYMKSMDPNDILKMTDNELLDLLESKLGFRSTANTIYRSKKKLGITTKRGEKLTKRSGGSLTMALENMGDMKKNMTLDEISKFLKDKYNVDASSTTLYQRLKKGDYVSKKTMGSSEIVRDALLKLDSLENVTLEQIKNIPEIKNLNLTKAALNTAISNARKTPGLEDFKIVKTKKPDFIEKLVSEGKINKQELDNFLAANPSISNPKLLEKFPILKNFDPQSIMRYRRQQGFSRRDNPETPPKIQLISNPTLDRRLQYVRNIEELYGDNINDKTIKVIKAHALGEGKVIDLNPKDIVALENKIKYIPEEFIDDTIKRPSFFLTSSGNDAHRVIENNLINTLVDKYQKLGYKFVDNPKMPWKKPDKEIDLSLPENKELANEIKALNKKIDGFKDDLFKMDAFTLFYNPIKDKMVSYGKPVSEVPGLANIVTRIKKGKLDLKDGGMVSIFEMTRPLNAQR